MSKLLQIKVKTIKDEIFIFMKNIKKLICHTVRNSFNSLFQTQAKTAKVCIAWKQNASSSRVSMPSVEELC